MNKDQKVKGPDLLDGEQQAAVTRRSVIKAGIGLFAATIIGTALRVDAQSEQEAMQDGLQAFNQEQLRTLEAIADRIWPPDDQDAGAAELGAAYYIDRALAGAYRLYDDVYRRALNQIDEMSMTEYGALFHELGSGQQDAILTTLENLDESEDLVAQLEGPEFELGPDSTFGMLRTHVMEGVFSDPIYGGNRDFGGWRAVNYPGAHYIYTAEEQQTFEPLNKPFLSVADL